MARLLLTLLTLAAAVGCAADQQQDPTPPTLTTTSEAKVVADLRGHGFKVTMRRAANHEPMYAGTGTLAGRIDGVEAVVLTFQRPGQAAKWADLSGRLNGVGVVADAWAISLGPATDRGDRSATARAHQVALARRIAAAIGGTLTT